MTWGVVVAGEPACAVSGSRHDCPRRPDAGPPVRQARRPQPRWRHRCHYELGLLTDTGPTDREPAAQ